MSPDPLLQRSITVFSPLPQEILDMPLSYSKTETFNSYFRSIFTSEDSSSMLHMEGAPFPDMPSISISNEEVYHQLSNLQSNKTSGLDKILEYFFKRTAPLIAPILFLIFQSSLNQGTLPSD